MDNADIGNKIIQIALESIKCYLQDRSYFQLPELLPSILKQKSACFVSLKTKDSLRGCIGTIEPVHPLLAKEIQNNAISAATRDPRFLPVTLNELSAIKCSVDVLMPSFKVESIENLDPLKYGVIVESGAKRGVLLPNIEGVDDIMQQISIAAQKAGINLSDNPNIYAFEVERYNER